MSNLANDIEQTQRDQHTAPAHNNNSAFQLKGSLFTLMVLQILKTDISALSAQLNKTIQQVPNFFNNTPVVIDLEKINQATDSFGFTTLHRLLIKCGLIPVGVRNGNAQQHHDAIEAGFGILTHMRGEATVAESVQSKPTINKRPKVITQPVRSGQQIHAENSDLIVLASVSPGAELLADGNIHVYGTLRGRALAGISGDTQARIFCQKLEAELISIAGHYKLNEEVNISVGEAGIQIYLSKDKLCIAAL